MNMFAAPEDPNGPPALDPAVTEPHHRARPARRPRPARRRVVIGARLLVVLAVAGVTSRCCPAARPRGPPPVSGAAAGAGPAGRATPRPGAERATGRRPVPSAPVATALLIGTVVSNAGGTLVVAPDGGGPNVTVRTDTQHPHARRPGRRTPADLQPGARVVVRVSGTGDTARPRSACPARRPRVTGTVTALSGGDLTVLQANGLSVS